MKKRIEIELLPKDFKGNEYTDNNDCALARAAKRYFKTEANCGPFYLHISAQGEDKHYEIIKHFNDEDYNYVKDAYTKDPKALKAIYVVTLEEV